MAVKRWIGSTSTAVTTAANWSGAALPVNGDKVIFDSSAVGDCVGDLAANKATNINIGRLFERDIGTVSTAAILQNRHQNQVTTIDMTKGFANLQLLTTDCVIRSAPFGDNLYITGDITTCVISGAGGNITFGSTGSFECTTMVIAPNTNLGPDPSVNVTIAAGGVGTLIAGGPCTIDFTKGSGDACTTAILVGSKLKAHLHDDFGTTKLVIIDAEVDEDKAAPILGGSGGLLLSNSILRLKAGCEQASIGSGGDVDLFKSSLLDISNATLSAIGTVTSYGGVILPQRPVTMAVPSDTKLSSTSGRSLNFQLAANSGHVPTVLW